MNEDQPNNNLFEERPGWIGLRIPIIKFEIAEQWR